MFIDWKISDSFPFNHISTTSAINSTRKLTMRRRHAMHPALGIRPADWLQAKLIAAVQKLL